MVALYSLLSLGGFGLCVALGYSFIVGVWDQTRRTDSLIALNKSQIAVNEAQVQLIGAQTDLAKAQAAIAWAQASIMQAIAIFGIPVLALASLAVSLFMISMVIREYRKLQEVKLQAAIKQASSLPRTPQQLRNTQPTIIIIPQDADKRGVPQRQLVLPTQAPRQLGSGDPPRYQKF